MATNVPVASGSHPSSRTLHSLPNHPRLSLSHRALGFLLAILLIASQAAGLDASPLRAAADKAMWSVVALMEPRNHRVYCSGFVVAPERVLTAAHCIEAAQEAGVPLLVDGAPAEVVYMVPSTGQDVALLRTKTEKPPLRAREAPIHPELPVVGLGWALGEAPIGVESRVLHTQFRSERRPTAVFITFEGGWIDGMSGGPVIDEQGRVVAMIQWTRYLHGMPVFSGGTATPTLIELLAAHCAHCEAQP